mmetsp:Transcript_15449/g.41467  ORF Transcript_15449/g.41467 Transcript_15449/m.41467 type:complete len:306 (+) Transcript_15449:54-971(+)
MGERGEGAARYALRADRSPSAHLSAGQRERSLRAKVYDAVDGEVDSWVEWSILGLIVANVLAFLIGTVVYKSHKKADPEFPCPTDASCVTYAEHWQGPLDAFELFSVLVFSIEYVLRVWACMENPEFSRYGSVVGRLSYLSSFYALVDLFAIAPYYLSALGLVRDVDFTTALRVFRLIRLLKAEKYLRAFSLLDDVISENGTLLVACVYYALMVWVLFSTAMYYIERYNPEIAQYYQSIPDAMLPTALMLTGEFPITEFSPLGRFVAASMAVLAVAFFALPTAVLGSGFIRAVERARGIEEGEVE